MKLIFLFISLLLTNISAFAQVNGVRDIIKDPTVSRRCKSLIRQRNDKKQMLQRLSSVLQRNNKLLKRLKTNQKSATQKLLLSKSEITNNIRLTKLRVKTMEENIVRKGCPGISL